MKHEKTKTIPLCASISLSFFSVAMLVAAILLTVSAICFWQYAILLSALAVCSAGIAGACLMADFFLTRNQLAQTAWHAGVSVAKIIPSCVKEFVDSCSHYGKGYELEDDLCNKL